MRRAPASLVRFVRLASVCAALAVAVAGPAHASGLSPYEEESLRHALDVVHGTIDPAPEGKLVEAIDVVALEVIEDRDPAPNILNALHTTTRPATTRRESLVHVGERYRQELVHETIRELTTF